jgi:ERI1 exoribonuclease 3
MTDLLKHYSIELVGRHHSGIDDTRNIASVVLKMLETGQGHCLNITATR